MNHLNMILGNINNNNSLNIIKNIIGNGNPKQMIMKYINNTSPQMQKIINLANSGNTEELAEIARQQGTLLDDSNFVEHYLNERYEKVYYKCMNCNMTLKEFARKYNKGIYLVTMKNHITCVIDGEVYDTWDCSSKNIWCAWNVK